MLKIVYPICCGIDVHKGLIAACIATTNDHGVTTYKSKRFSTFTNELRRCAVWLADNHCKDVCMESTGKYWIPVYNILETTCTIVLAHPNTLRLYRERRPTRKTPSGSPTFSNTIWCPAVLSLLLIFGSSGIWCVTIGN